MNIKNFFPAIALITLLPSIATAQPVANASDVSPNFTGEFYFAPADGFSPGSAGPNQTWNYSSLQTTLAGIDTTIPVAGSPYAGTFPTANYCYKFSSTFLGPDRFYYHNLTSTTFEILSLGYNASAGDNYTPNPRTFAVFPYTYNTVYSDTYQATDDVSETSFTATYDAYGTLILPTGTYTNVIRQKIVKNGQTDYVWFNVSPFYPLLQTVLAENSLGIVKSTTVLGVNDNDRNNMFTVFPNPSEGNFEIALENNDHGFEVCVYDVLGNKIRKIDTAWENNTMMLNLVDEPIGLYYLNITDKETGATHTKKIIKK